MTGKKATVAGRVSFEGERATLTFQGRLAHPPEAVWDALTDPKQLSSWYMTQAAIDGRPGGYIDLRTGPGQLHATGRILTWDPPRVLEYEWKVKPWRGMPNGEDAIVRWELQPNGQGTLLTLTHRNLTRRSALGAISSMHVVLERLAAHLEGSPFDDFRTRVAEVQTQYPKPEEAN